MHPTQPPPGPDSDLLDLPPDEVMHDLARVGAMFGSNRLVSGPLPPTPAEISAAAVDAALRGLLRNGLITVAPHSDFAKWIPIDSWKDPS